MDKRKRIGRRLLALTLAAVMALGSTLECWAAAVDWPVDAGKSESVTAGALLAKAYDSELTDAEKALLNAGLLLGDGLQCLPAKLELLGGDACLVTLREGKFHQVKRMLASRGKPVLYLKRLAMGPLTLEDTLPAGQCRPLTEEEISALRCACGV